MRHLFGLLLEKIANVLYDTAAWFYTQADKHINYNRRRDPDDESYP